MWVGFFTSSRGTKNGPADPILEFRVKREILKGSKGPFLVPSELGKKSQTLGKILRTSEKGEILRT